MASSPYETLGVAKDADAATIRRAYRKKAKTAHPDRGGSPEEFTKLTTALTVLLDPVRREKFDRTGEADGDPHNPEQEAMSAAASALMAAVAQGGDPQFNNLLAAARSIVADQRRQIVAQRAEIAKGIGMLEKAQRRFAKKKGSPGEDWIMAAFNAQIGHLRDNDQTQERNLGIVDRAMGLLEFYEYVVDQSPQGSSQYHADIRTFIEQVLR